MQTRFPAFIAVGLLAVAVLAAVKVPAVPPPPPVVLVPGQPFPASPTFTTLAVLVTNVMIPAYQTAVAKFGELAHATEQLTQAPDTNSLQVVHRAWREANAAWKFTEAFRCGPAAELSVASRINNWPVRPSSIQSLLRDSKPMDGAMMEELGVSVLGLAALEYLVFDPTPGDTNVIASLAGAPGERRRMYVAALGRDLALKSAALEQEFHSGDTDFRGRFAVGGQESLTILVNQMIAAVENGAVERVRKIAELPPGRRHQPDSFEGSLSRTSQDSVLAALRGAQRIYDGGSGPGLDDYLRRLSAPIESRLTQQFQTAITAVASLGGPIELAMDRQPSAVLAAQDEIKALEVILKVDLISALGVTLTFGANDGD